MPERRAYSIDLLCFIVRTFLRKSFNVYAARFILPLFILLATSTTQYSICVDASFCDLIPPFLAISRPYFFQATLSANNNFVDVELGQAPICVVVREFLFISQYRTWRRRSVWVGSIETDKGFSPGQLTLLRPLLFRLYAGHGGLRNITIKPNGAKRPAGVLLLGDMAHRQDEQGQAPQAHKEREQKASFSFPVVFKSSRE